MNNNLLQLFLSRCAAVSECWSYETLMPDLNAILIYVTQPIIHHLFAFIAAQDTNDSVVFTTINFSNVYSRVQQANWSLHRL